MAQNSMLKIKQRLLSFIVGRPGLLRNASMILMNLLRRKCLSSQLQPEFRFIRTLQSPHHVVPDENAGRFRISSKAFGPSKADGGLSGDLEQILLGDGLPVTAMFPALSRAVGAAAITIKKIRDAGGKIEHDPAWKNWYHGSIFEVTGSVKKKLHKAAVEIIPIDQAEAARIHAEWHSVRSSTSAE